MYFTELGRRPIDSQNPTGTDPNQLDLFSELKRSVNKLNTANRNVSWDEIHDLSSEILESHSKDFRCASYYCVAAAKTQGLKGLINGINTLVDISVIYWFSAYPEQQKTRARAQAIEWMIEHIVKLQKTFKITHEQYALIECGHRLVLKLEQEFKEQMGNEAPPLGVLRRLFRSWLDQVVAEKERLQAKAKTESAAAKVESAIVEAPPVLPPQLENKTVVKKRVPFWYFPVIGVVLIISAYFAVTQSQLVYYKTEVAESSDAEFLQLLTTLKNANSSITTKLKDPILFRAEQSLNNWMSYPEKIYSYRTYQGIVDAIATIYPDSLQAKKLNKKYTSDEVLLRSDYDRLSTNFRQARTAIANLKKELTGDRLFDDPYRYSNTLFPLLGRLEYLEHSVPTKESIEKAQRIINTYQFRLTKIKEKNEKTISLP